METEWTSHHFALFQHCFYENWARMEFILGRVPSSSITLKQYFISFFTLFQLISLWLDVGGTGRWNWWLWDSPDPSYTPSSFPLVSWENNFKNYARGICEVEMSPKGFLQCGNTYDFQNQKKNPSLSYADSPLAGWWAMPINGINLHIFVKQVQDGKHWPKSCKECCLINKNHWRQFVDTVIWSFSALPNSLFFLSGAFCGDDSGVHFSKGIFFDSISAFR